LRPTIIRIAKFHESPVVFSDGAFFIDYGGLRMHNSENNSISKRLLNVEETAVFLGISVRTIYNQTCRKAKKNFPVKPKRIGKRILFDIQDLESFVNSL